MSTGLKLNVKNVILGCHNFSEFFAKRDSCFYSGFSHLIKPKCPYHKQYYVRTNTLDHTEAVLPRSFDKISVNWISSEIPRINNSFDNVHIGRISIHGSRLPWESPIRFYYEKKCPKCPPPCPKIPKDCSEPPVPPCPPIAKVPKCPTKPKCYPIKPKKDPCAKSTPCTLKAFPLYSCRYMSGGDPCQPKPPKPRISKPRFCKPKREVYRPTPKCRSPAHCGPTACRPTDSDKRCKPKFGQSSGGDGGELCGGKLGKPKDCYSTPGRPSEPAPQTSNQNPICPPTTKPCGK